MLLDQRMHSMNKSMITIFVFFTFTGFCENSQFTHDLSEHDEQQTIAQVQKEVDQRLKLSYKKFQEKLNKINDLQETTRKELDALFEIYFKAIAEFGGSNVDSFKTLYFQFLANADNQIALFKAHAQDIINHHASKLNNWNITNQTTDNLNELQPLNLEKYLPDLDRSLILKFKNNLEVYKQNLINLLYSLKNSRLRESGLEILYHNELRQSLGNYTPATHKAEVKTYWQNFRHEGSLFFKNFSNAFVPKFLDAAKGGLKNAGKELLDEFSKKVKKEGTNISKEVANEFLQKLGLVGKEEKKDSSKEEDKKE